MEYTTFVRKPFVVEAVEVTEDNIAEIAEIIGTLRHKENGSPFIQVNRRLIPNLFRVFPGFWLTKMGDGDNMRCYSRRIFKQQFVETLPEIDEWVRYINGKGDEAAPAHEFVEVGDPDANIEDSEIAVRSDVVQPQD